MPMNTIQGPESIFGLRFFLLTPRCFIFLTNSKSHHGAPPAPPAAQGRAPCPWELFFLLTTFQWWVTSTTKENMFKIVHLQHHFSSLCEGLPQQYPKKKRWTKNTSLGAALASSKFLFAPASNPKRSKMPGWIWSKAPHPRLKTP